MTKREVKTEESNLKLFPKEIPLWIKDRLEGEDVIAIMDTGLYKGRFAKTSVVLTNKRIMVYKKEDILEDISLTRIEEASIRTYLNVCILVVKTDDVSRGIVAFSRNRFKSLEKLVTIINNLVIGKISYELLKSSVTKEIKLSEKRIFKRLFDLLRPTLPLIVVSLILSMVLRIFDLTPPYLIKILVDEVLTPRAHIEKLYWILTALLALFIGQIIFNVIKGYVNTKLNLLISRIMRSAIFKKLQRTSLFYHDKFGSGGLFTRIFDDARQIQDFIVRSLQSAAINAGAVVFVGAMLVSLSLKLTIISILPLFITFIMAIFYSMRAPLYYFRVWRKWSNLVSTVSDALNAVLLLKSYRKE
ncbi:ABC transporter ATP-binding protein, partial [Candidatus Bathyarchaeota archaeon]